jgi:hypothetical protein
MKEVHSGRALSDVNNSSEIGHSGMQGATRSGVLKLIDSEEKYLCDGRNPRIMLAIKENSVEKVASYSEVAKRNVSVCGNGCKQLK